MVTVGTVNPKLTIMLVLLFLALVVAIVVMAYRLSKAKRELFIANQESARARVRQKSAAGRAEEAEQQAARLMHSVEVAIATTRQAVANNEQTETVSQQLGQLYAYVTTPLEELPAGPDHAGTYR